MGNLNPFSSYTQSNIEDNVEPDVTSPDHVDQTSDTDETSPNQTNEINDNNQPNEHKSNEFIRQQSPNEDDQSQTALTAEEYMKEYIHSDSIAKSQNKPRNGKLLFQTSNTINFEFYENTVPNYQRRFIIVHCKPEKKKYQFLYDVSSLSAAMHDDFRQFVTDVQAIFGDLQECLSSGQDVIIPSPTLQDITNNTIYHDAHIHHKIGISNAPLDNLDRAQYIQMLKYIEIEIQKLSHHAADISYTHYYIPIQFQTKTDDASDTKESNETESKEVDNPGDYRNDIVRYSSDSDSDSLSSVAVISSTITKKMPHVCSNNESNCKEVWEVCGVDYRDYPGCNLNEAKWSTYPEQISDAISKLEIGEDYGFTEDGQSFIITKITRDQAIQQRMDTDDKTNKRAVRIKQIQSAKEPVMHHRYNRNYRRTQNEENRQNNESQNALPTPPPIINSITTQEYKEEGTNDLVCGRIGSKPEWRLVIDSNVTAHAWPPNGELTKRCECLKIGESSDFEFDLARYGSRKFIIERKLLNIAFLIDEKYNVVKLMRFESSSKSFLGQQYPTWWDDDSLIFGTTIPNRDASRKWAETMSHSQIISVTGIRDQYLMDMYKLEKQCMISVNEPVNEQIMFYGNGNEEINMILRDGFRRELSTHTFWGHGTYFNTWPIDAHRHGHLTIRGHDPLPNGKWTMLVCTVITGQSKIGNRYMTLEDWPRGVNGKIYDSLTDKKHSIVVIHKDAR
eukprot:510086_1